MLQSTIIIYLVLTCEVYGFMLKVKIIMNNIMDNKNIMDR